MAATFFEEPMDPMMMQTPDDDFSARMAEGKRNALKRNGKAAKEGPRKRGLRENARDALYHEILIEHHLAEKGHRDWIEHAMRAGQLLLRAKVQMKHGSFMKWIAEWNEFSHATANLYMRLAKSRRRIEANSEYVKNLSLLAVDGWLRDGQPDKPNEPTLTGSTVREKQWRKQFNKIYDLFDDFNQFLSPTTREGKQLWTLATANPFEIKQMITTCEDVRRQIDLLIADLKGHLNKIFEQQREDALAGMYDKDREAVRLLDVLDEPAPEIAVSANAVMTETRHLPTSMESP